MNSPAALSAADLADERLAAAESEVIVDGLTAVTADHVRDALANVAATAAAHPHAFRLVVVG